LRPILPAGLAEEIDWPTLTRCPGSFVDPALRERHTDLLFSVAFRGGANAFVYILFEHQSTPTPHMAYRLLRYMVRIWERWSAEHAATDAFPAIVPVVLYHGAVPWSAPRSFDALLDLPDGVQPALNPYLVRFSFVLDDLSEVPDQTLRARAMTALGKLAVVCLKHARTRKDLVEILGSWADVMREVVAAANGLEALESVMRYIYIVNDDFQPEALQALLEREVGPEAKDATVTVGEKLIQQGKQEGKQEGIQLGKQEGIQQGERGLLLRLLRRRFGNQVDTDTEQRIAAASTEQIDIWAERVLSAATLTEVLAD